VPVYNLRGVSDLILTPNALAQIFEGLKHLDKMKDITPQQVEVGTPSPTTTQTPLSQNRHQRQPLQCHQQEPPLLHHHHQQTEHRRQADCRSARLHHG
jgi:hypothetical protein